jgi:hypothetical protein
MGHRTTRTIRWNLRRALLGVAMVLHLGWLTAGAMPAAASMAADDARMTSMDMDVTAMSAVPCHEAPALPSQDASSAHHGAPAPQTGPSQSSCCTHGCVCATGACFLSAAIVQTRLTWVQYRLPLVGVALQTVRTPAPELRPPIQG